MAELLVAYADDPAGSNMATHLAACMERGTDRMPGPAGKKISGFWHSDYYDLVTISSPAISADWLKGVPFVTGGEEYDGYVFLSRHSAESGVLALTCHSTGNFGEALFGGNDAEVAIPHPHLQKAYLRNLHAERDSPKFSEFDITIEATHHGPTALDKPVLFVEVGTTPVQWSDAALCGEVADVLHRTLVSDMLQSPVAICFGGTHYPKRFTSEILDGTHALGTVIPKRFIRLLDDDLFEHIMLRNKAASVALLDWGGIPGPDKRRLEDLLSTTNLDVRRI